MLNAGRGVFHFGRANTGHEDVTQTNCTSILLLAMLPLPILKSRFPAGEPGNQPGQLRACAEGKVPKQQ